MRKGEVERRTREKKGGICRREEKIRAEKRREDNIGQEMRRRY